MVERFDSHVDDPMEREQANHGNYGVPGNRLTRSLWGYIRRTTSIEPSRFNRKQLNSLFGKIARGEKIPRSIDGIKLKGSRVGKPPTKKMRDYVRPFMTSQGKPKGIWKRDDTFTALKLTSFKDVSRSETWKGVKVLVVRDAKGHFISWKRS